MRQLSLLFLGLLFALPASAQLATPSLSPTPSLSLIATVSPIGASPDAVHLDHNGTATPCGPSLIGTTPTGLSFPDGKTGPARAFSKITLSPSGFLCLSTGGPASITAGACDPGSIRVDPGNSLTISASPPLLLSMVASLDNTPLVCAYQ